MYRPSIDRVSTEYQLSVGQVSVDISTDTIGRYLADTTFSTHDPTCLPKCKQYITSRYVNTHLGINMFVTEQKQTHEIAYK